MKYRIAALCNNEVFRTELIRSLEACLNIIKSGQPYHSIASIWIEAVR